MKAELIAKLRCEDYANSFRVPVYYVGKSCIFTHKTSYCTAHPKYWRNRKEKRWW